MRMLKMLLHGAIKVSKLSNWEEEFPFAPFYLKDPQKGKKSGLR